MNHKLPRPVIAIVVLAIVVALYFGLANLNRRWQRRTNCLRFHRSHHVNVSPELAGKVLQVDVEEGTLVKTNDPLLHLDPSLLTAQRAVAAANLDSAKAGAVTAQSALNTANSQYQIALEAALAQDKKARIQDWFSKDPNQFDQPDWYFSRTEQLQSAQDQTDIALKALTDAQSKLANVNQSVEKSEFLTAEKRLLDARLAYLTAKDVNNLAQNSADANAPVGRYNRTHCGTNDGYKVDNKKLTNFVYGCTGDDHLSEMGDNLFDAAEKELDDAQKAYDELLGTQASDEILQSTR